VCYHYLARLFPVDCLTLGNIVLVLRLKIYIMAVDSEVCGTTHLLRMICRPKNFDFDDVSF